MKVAALCAGYGGLELGVAAAGVAADLSWFAEIDKHAAQVMSAHHPDAPNLGDLTGITDPPQVDVVTAGFPCQPVSNAGKREGVNDERWLIDDVCRVARDAGARWLILENVGGLLTANGGDAMARVVACLAEIGFAAEWGCLRAADVGAPHGRLRWFCVAYAEGTEWGGEKHELLGSPVGPAAEHRERNRKAAADADVTGPQGTQPTKRRHLPARGVDFGPYRPAVERWESTIGRAAPKPTDDKRRLNPRFVEWMMGLDDGWVCDHVEGRSHQLRILGNGVVPQQAAEALRQLLERVP